MYRSFFLIIPLILSVLPIENATSFETFVKERLVIELSTHSRYQFIVEIADTPARRSQGLMYRRSLDDNKGMLFLFESPQVTRFWMRNTFISLDMLFISSQGRIVHIHKNAVPHSLQTISSKVPVTGALEIKGGMVDRLGIRLGDCILHPAFNNDPLP